MGCQVYKSLAKVAADAVLFISKKTYIRLSGLLLLRQFLGLHDDDLGQRADDE